MSKARETSYLVTWETPDGTETAHISASSRRNAAAAVMATNGPDRVAVYTLPAHSPHPTRYRRETVTETRVMEEEG